MRSLLVLAALATIASGCSKDGANQSISDAHHSSTTDATMQGGEMAGGMTMSGDMEKDMPMMNDMMVRGLGQGDSLYDHRFIDMMIPHHEGAVKMATDAQVKANRPELKKLAQRIIAGQQTEIDQMNDWRADWYGANSQTGAANRDEMMQHMSSMNDTMVRKLGPRDADYEDRFIDMMVPHHEAAIKMAEDALSKATHPELKALARSIIGAQRKEIGEMERWRQEWYGH